MRQVPLLSLHHPPTECDYRIKKKRPKQKNRDEKGDIPRPSALIADKRENGKDISNKGAPHIAHEYLSRRKIVPEKTHATSSQEQTQNKYVRVPQAPSNVSQKTCHDDPDAGCKPVNAVHKIIETHNRYDPENGDRDTENTQIDPT